MNVINSIYSASFGRHFSKYAVKPCGASHSAAAIRYLQIDGWDCWDWLTSLLGQSGRATGFIPCEGGAKDLTLTRQTLNATVWLVCHYLAINSVVQAAGGDQEAKGNERHLLSNVRQLVLEGHRSREGYFSADGSLMVFQSER